MSEQAKWTSPQGVTYTGSDDFISGARMAHEGEVAPLRDRLKDLADEWEKRAEAPGLVATTYHHAASELRSLIEGKGS